MWNLFAKKLRERGEISQKTCARSKARVLKNLATEKLCGERSKRGATRFFALFRTEKRRDVKIGNYFGALYIEESLNCGAS